MSNTEAKQPWTNHFFAILPNASGSAIFMFPSPEGWRLPYVRGEDFWLSDSARIIPLLRAALGAAVDFTILRYLSIEANEQERWDRILFVLEPRQSLYTPPAGGQWVDRMALYHTPLALTEQTPPIMRYLEENEQSSGPTQIHPHRSPWARPGWFASASAWIEEAITELGYRQTGPIEQRRNWSISSLLIAPTAQGKLYFKAAAALPLFVHEPALTQTLSELYPGRVPTPLKVDYERRWLLMEDFGEVAGRNDDADFASILRAFGSLQRESADHLDQLLAAGCIDRSLSVLTSQIDPLIADPITQGALSPQEYDELASLAPHLKEQCARLAEYKIPSTLLHGDLHLGNVTRRNGDYLFFDWTDGAVSFPFLDHFLLYFDAEDVSDPIRCRDAYLEAWRDYESPERLLEAWELARPLCALHHAVSYLSIVNNIEPVTREELFHGLPDNLRRLLAAMRPSLSTPP